MKRLGDNKKLSAKLIIKKYLNGKGFSLSELLLACLIMLIATQITVQTMTVAQRNFHRNVQISEAETLCSTLAIYVESELMYAKYNPVSETFYSDIHHFGPEAYFVVAPVASDGSIGTEDKIGEDVGEFGVIGETSPTYQEGSSSSYFNIAGNGVYGIDNKAYPNGKSAYGLKAGMGLSVDENSNTATVKIKIVDAKTSNELASRVIKVNVKVKE